MSKLVNISQRIREFLAKAEKQTTHLATEDAALAVKARALELADKTQRLADLDFMCQGHRTTCRERGLLAAMQTIPGGKMGTQILTPKSVGTGAKQKMWVEAATDVATLREWRAALQQRAIECNEWQSPQIVGDDNLLTELKKAILDSPTDPPEEE